MSSKPAGGAGQVPVRPAWGARHARFGPLAKPKNTRETLKRLWGYLKQHKKLLLLVFLLVTLGAVFNLAGPFLIGRAIDDYLVPGDFPGLLRMCLLLLLVYGLGSLTAWWQNYAVIDLAQLTVKEIRQDLFDKLQTLPVRFFDERTHGDLMSRLTNDVDNISNTLNNSITHLFYSLLMLTGAMAVMLWMSPVLTLLTVLVTPLMGVTTAAIAKRTRAFFSRQQQALGELNGFIEETISGQKTVQMFNRENRQIDAFTGFNRQLLAAGIRAQIFSGFMMPLMHVFNNLSFIVVAAVGGWLAVKGVVSVGVIASFLNYAKQFVRPVNEIANQFNMIQSALAGAERVFAVMDEPPEKAGDGTEPGRLRVVKGHVEFRHVSFSYRPGVPVLKNINLVAHPGQTVALVGPTGAGKTTVINLLTRFYDVDEGAIYIDGQDIRNIDREELRSFLGIVLQDTYLFSETVADNIRYGRLSATDEEVRRAARLANAEHFILRLPQGYDTVLGEDGGNLSQGQRQLLAIARAILADPAILILDEATSNVDTRTEVYIQQAMAELMKGRTSFVIAHRLSTVRNADQILVIDQGEIIERGTHRELMARKGFYYNLYRSNWLGVTNA